MKNSVIFIFILFMAVRVTAQESKKEPNILIIMLDDAGLDMSAYGSTYVKTPAFDKIAEQGILFKNAYTPNAKCAPSRASILTGRNSWQLDAAANHYIYFPTKFKTYQEALNDKGYFTGFTGKGYAPGVALNEDGSKRFLLGKAFDIHKLKPPTSQISRHNYATNFESFLDSVPSNNPWSFWVGINEPHRAYEFKTGERLGNKTMDMIKEVPKFWPDSTTVRHDMLDYAFEIEYADSHIDRILNTLQKRKLLKNTIVIVTSDHGMPFPRVKGNQYEMANHVPMAIMWKGKIPEKRKVNDFISFIDIAPTLLEIAGIPEKKSTMQPITGKSITSILYAKKNGWIDTSRNYVLIGKERHDCGRPNDWGYPIRGIVKENFLYLKNYEIKRWPSGNPETGYLNTDESPTKSLILNLRRTNIDKKYWKLNFGKRDSEELYDVSKDPYCINNLIDATELISVENELKEILQQKLVEQNDLRVNGYGYIYEQYPLSKFKNYYQKFLNGNKPKTSWVSDFDFEEYYLDENGNNLKKINNNEN